MNEKAEAHWITQAVVGSLIFAVLAGIILLFFGWWLDGKLNPSPELALSCYSDNNSVYLYIDNPSRYVAEDYNLLIYEKFGGMSGGSWAEGDLCNVNFHKFQPDRITSVQCEYIPPKTKTLIQINFANSSAKSFNYDSWGKTKSEEKGFLNCAGERTNEN